MSQRTFRCHPEGCPDKGLSLIHGICQLARDSEIRQLDVTRLAQQDIGSCKHKDEKLRLYRVKRSCFSSNDVWIMNSEFKIHLLLNAIANQSKEKWPVIKFRVNLNKGGGTGVSTHARLIIVSNVVAATSDLYELHTGSQIPLAAFLCAQGPAGVCANVPKWFPLRKQPIKTIPIFSASHETHTNKCSNKNIPG